MKIFINLLIYIVALLLVGCAANPTYVPPIGPNTAELTINNKSNYFIGIDVFQGGENCTEMTTVQVHVDPKHKTILDQRQRITVRIPADERFGFMFGSEWVQVGTMQTNCYVGGVFSPRPGARYEAGFQWSGGKCYVNVERVDGIVPYAPEPSFRITRLGANTCHKP